LKKQQLEIRTKDCRANIFVNFVLTVRRVQTTNAVNQAVKAVAFLKIYLKGFSSRKTIYTCNTYEKILMKIIIHNVNEWQC